MANKFLADLALEEMKEKLAGVNYMCPPQDSKKVARFYEVLGDLPCSSHFASQQIPFSSIPVVNINDSGEYIVPIEKKVITVSELSSYYNVPELYIYNSLLSCDFDTKSSTFAELIIFLSEYRARCSIYAKELGLIEYKNPNKYSSGEKEVYLDEIARAEQIPFDRLYEAYLKYKNIPETIQEIKNDDLRISLISQFQQVIDGSVVTDASKYRLYYLCLQKQAEIRRRLLSELRNPGIISLPVNDLHVLMLNNPNGHALMNPFFEADDREVFSLIFQTERNGEIFISSNTIEKILNILSEKRATKHENTQTFLKLISGAMDMSCDLSGTNLDLAQSEPIAESTSSFQGFPK